MMMINVPPHAAVKGTGRAVLAAQTAVPTPSDVL